MLVHAPTYSLGLLVLTYAPYALAAPVTPDVTLPLYETSPAHESVTTYFSNMNETIFGEDAGSFDYHVARDKALSIESMEYLAKIHTSDDPESVLLAVTNATLLGMVTAEQGANKTWLYNELGAAMASHSSACGGVYIAPIPAVEDAVDRGDLVKRSRWRWIKSGAHVSSSAAMEVLHRTLGNNVDSYFQNSPRDFCDKLRGIRACISWSKVEEFDHYYARTLIEDAMSKNNFNRWSEQANKTLGSRKRSPADVCISDRPKGCT